MASGMRSSSRVRGVPAGYQDENGGAAQEPSVLLEDKLGVIKTGEFDPEAYVQSKCPHMNEKEIRHLCSSLQDLKKASTDEIRRSIYANYSAFIRTSREISDLEGEILSMRNLLSLQSALLHGLADGIELDSLFTGLEGYPNAEISKFDDRKPSDIENWSAEFPDKLDVFLAEWRVEEALVALDEAEQRVAEAKEKQTLGRAELSLLQNVITACQQKLADQLAEAACQPSTIGVELRAAASALKRLGDAPRAQGLLLNAHTQRLQHRMRSVVPTSTLYGGSYITALSQQVFSSIARALSDFIDVFGNESGYASELVTWSRNQTEAFGQFIKKHALASAAGAGGLKAAAIAVQVAIGHSSLLEAHGLSLTPVLLELFRPIIEQAVQANLKRIEENTAVLAAADDWSLIYPPSAPRMSGRTSKTTAASGNSFLPKLSSSAHHLHLMVQDFFEDVGSLVSIKLGDSALEGILGVFKSYVRLLINALPSTIEDEVHLEGSRNKMVRMAESETQQLVLLANASLLAEDLLPRAALKLFPSNITSMEDSQRRAPRKQNYLLEQKEWKRKLQHSVDGLKDSFCKLHALDLIFNEDGDSNLNAEMYISLDKCAEEPEWSPSPFFQELFGKLNRIAAIAADIFVGRERFATMLLIRLTETFILWISQDQSFWDEIEEGPRLLGLFGLQQFCLDMVFVCVFASQGRYISRNLLQLIREVQNRAMSSYSTTGVDPYNVLPSDDWFVEIAQVTINKIVGRSQTSNGERELSSPTASMSASSISSSRSHGSS